VPPEGVPDKGSKNPKGLEFLSKMPPKCRRRAAQCGKLISELVFINDLTIDDAAGERILWELHQWLTR